MRGAGVDYYGSWLPGDRTLEISITNASNITAPSIGSFACTFNAAANLRDQFARAGPCNHTSPALNGRWTVNPAPTVISVVASDDGDNAYGMGDTFTFTFSEALNVPPGLSLTTSSVRDLFVCNQVLGAMFNAIFTSGTELVVTITNPAGNTLNLNTISFFVNSTVRSLTAQADMSRPMHGFTPAVTGGFSAAPTVLAAIAFGNTITVLFSQPLNAAGNVTFNKTLVDTLLQPNCVLGADYSASWPNASALVVTIHDLVGSTVIIGASRFNIDASLGVRNALSQSNVMSGLSPVITGSILPPPGPPPYVVSVMASNPWNDLMYGPPDMVTITFNEATNLGALAQSYNRTHLNAIFQPLFELGTDYRGTWISSSTLQIDIRNPSGANATIGVVLFRINGSAGIKNAAGTSNSSFGLTPAVTGSWIAVAVAAPTVTAVVAWNPLNLTVHTGAEIVVTFNAATNKGVQAVMYNMSSINQYFQPSSSLGTNYTARWSTPTTLTFTIHDGSGATADTGALFFNITAAADIRVAANNSVAAEGATGLVSGSFYFVSGTWNRCIPTPAVVCSLV